MAEFVEIMEQRKRMCEHYITEEGICHPKCPFAKLKDIAYGNCNNYLANKPQESEEIIMKWAKENPVKSNADVFRETFGYEIIKNSNDCSGLDCPEGHIRCDSCTLKGFWNKEYIEPKENK